MKGEEGRPQERSVVMGIPRMLTSTVKQGAVLHGEAALHTSHFPLGRHVLLGEQRLSTRLA